MTTLHLPIAPEAYAPGAHTRVEDELPHRRLRLYSTREMEADQTVWFKPAGGRDADSQEAKVLKSLDRYLALSVTGATPKGTLPYAEEPIDVKFNRFNDARYWFRTRVVKVVEDFDGMVCLVHTDRLLRRQARQYVRTPMECPVRFVPITETRLLARMLTGKTIPRREQCVGKLIDLSGGGCGIRTDMCVPDSKFLLLWFDFLARDLLIETSAEIVGVTDLDFDGEVRHRIHLKFRHIPEAMRRRIIQYVFERQLHRPND